MQKPGKNLTTVRQIWEENFYREQEFIRQVVVRHNYVAVATRTIPVAAAPSPASSSSSAAAATATSPTPASSAAAATATSPTPASSAASSTATSPTPASSAAAATATSPTTDEMYATLRSRANAMRLVQLGLTFSDEGGNLPKDPVTGKSYTWEFNIKVAKSMDEIDDSFRQHLTERGVDVDFNMKHAIDPDVFCIGFWCTDTLMKERIRWVVFTGPAAFSPLLNIMRAEAQLPERWEDFLDVAKVYFPMVYEVKQLMISGGLSGTLEEVAKVLSVAVTEGEVFNQVGHKSLLMLQVFMALMKRHFGGEHRKIEPT